MNGHHFHPQFDIELKISVMKKVETPSFKCHEQFFRIECAFQAVHITNWEVLMWFDSEAAVRVSGAAETVDYFG